MKTTKPYINCSICGEQTNRFYVDFEGNICGECLVKKNNGSFPKGKGSHVPCKLCKEPEIYWLSPKIYGKKDKDCGNHESDLLNKLFDD